LRGQLFLRLLKKAAAGAFLFLFCAAFLFLRSRRQPPAALFLRLLKKAAGGGMP
jgi:hypothetical protein